MKFAIAYCRQSFQRPDKASTVTWQQSKIETNAKKLDIHIQEYFSEIKSGKNTQRTEYQRMLTLIKSGTITDLFVYRIDRLSRNTKDLLDFLEICAEHNVHIRSLVEGDFDYSAVNDRIKLQTLAIIAELQRTISRENREINNIKKFNTGQIVNYAPPFGYRYHGKFEVESDEARTVKVVFEQYLKGLGYKRIAQHTQADSTLVTRNPAQVKYILTNLKYTGVYKSKYGILYDVVPAIISEDVFASAERERHQRAERRQQRHTVTAQLRQKIICPYCGLKLTTYYYRSQTNAQPFYVCQKKMSGQYDDCPMPFLPLKQFESKVLQQLVQFFVSKDQLHLLHQKALDKIKQTQKQFVDETRQYEAHKDQLIDRLAAGEITLTAFQDALSGLEASRTQTTEHNKRPNVTPEQISNLIQTNPNLHDELWSYVKYVKVDTNSNLIDIRLEDIDINIINFNAKEPIFNE